MVNSGMKESSMERFRRKQELSSSELGKVIGGANYESATGKYKITCSTVGCTLNLDIEPTCWDPTCLVCPFCQTGTISYTFEPY